MVDGFSSFYMQELKASATFMREALQQVKLQPFDCLLCLHLLQPLGNNCLGQFGASRLPFLGWSSLCTLLCSWHRGLWQYTCLVCNLHDGIVCWKLLLCLLAIESSCNFIRCFSVDVISASKIGCHIPRSMFCWPLLLQQDHAKNQSDQNLKILLSWLCCASVKMPHLLYRFQCFWHI